MLTHHYIDLETMEFKTKEVTPEPLDPFGGDPRRRIYWEPMTNNHERVCFDRFAAIEAALIKVEDEAALIKLKQIQLEIKRARLKSLLITL